MVPIEIFTNLSEEEFNKLIEESNKFKALKFLIWLRDEIGCCPMSKENKGGSPSNGELRRWIKNKCVFVNGEIINGESIIYMPITSLVFFPNNNKARCTMI